MSNIWLAQQYFEKNYNRWVNVLKGQFLDDIYVADTDAYYDSPDYDYDIPTNAEEFGMVLKLRNGLLFRVTYNGDKPMMLIETNTDITQTIRVENFWDCDNEDELIDTPIWQPLADFHDVEIIDVAPSFDWDEKVDGVILVFPDGNLCIKCDGFYVLNVESPRYIKRIEFRKMFALMSDWLSQFNGYRSDLELHSKGRNPDEKFVFDKLAHREDISSLFGRCKLGYSNNCLPSHKETSNILIELTLISGAAAPEKIFDTFSWFCNECCSKTSKCEDCVISPYCNRNSQAAGS